MRRATILLKGLAVAGLIGLAMAAGPTTDPAGGFDPVLRLAPLEPGRSMPSTTPDPSTIPRRAGYGTVRLSSQATNGDPRNDFYLLIPREFIGSKVDRLTQGWDFAMFVYYPEMAAEGSSDKDRICPCGVQPLGQVLLYLKNDLGLDTEGAPERAYRILLDDIQPGHYGGGGRVDSSNPNAIIVDSGLDYPPASQKRSFAYRENGKVSLFVSCNPHTPYPRCTASTMSRVQAGLRIEFSFSMQLMPEVHALQGAVIKFVDGFVADARSAQQSTFKGN